MWLVMFRKMIFTWYLCSWFSIQKVMKTINEVNPTEAYLEGMLWAAYGVKVISCDAVEWQIDAVKECAKELKEKEIEHSALSPTEKENQKRLWKQWIDETTKGFKDELKRVGRIV